MPSVAHYQPYNNGGWKCTILLICAKTAQLLSRSGFARMIWNNYLLLLQKDEGVFVSIDETLVANMVVVKRGYQ